MRKRNGNGKPPTPTLQAEFDAGRYPPVIDVKPGRTAGMRGVIACAKCRALVPKETYITDSGLCFDCYYAIHPPKTGWKGETRASMSEYDDAIRTRDARIAETWERCCREHGLNPHSEDLRRLRDHFYRDFTQAELSRITGDNPSTIRRGVERAKRMLARFGLNIPDRPRYDDVKIERHDPLALDRGFATDAGRIIRADAEIAPTEDEAEYQQSVESRKSTNGK